MSNHMPHCKWFGRDWLGDPLLRMVGPTERGVWMDLLCVMMCSERYGYLTLRGQPMPDEDAARIVGIPAEEYKAVLARLEAVGIPSRTSDGTLYSRRLVRDYEAYKTFSRAGRKGGGNPELRKKEPKKDIPSDTQKPEARSQKPEAMSPLQHSLKGGYKEGYKGQEGEENQALSTQSREGGQQTPADSQEKKTPKKPSIPDDEWLKQVQTEYTWADVQAEAVKGRRWCLEHNRTFSRQFFVNWLNKVPKPMSGGDQPHRRTTHADDRRADQAAREYPEPDKEMPRL